MHHAPHQALDVRPVLHIIGLLLVTLGLFMAVPAIGDGINDHPDWEAFAEAAVLTVYVGAAMALATRTGSVNLDRRQGFLLITLAWMTITVFGGLPFMFSALQLSLTDAVFETISGLTTTGSTVIVGLDHAPPGILLWRGLLQWLGGVGIIVMAVALLPFLRVGGMQLFKMESSDVSEKSMPRVRRVASGVIVIYVMLSATCALCLWLAGMSPFEAAIHAMTTLSTGGFSTSDQSLAHFKSPAIEWIVTLFMIVGAMPMIGFVQLAAGNRRAIVRDSQVRSFIGLLGVAWLILAIWLWAKHGMNPLDALRVAVFTATSLITTTGFRGVDYLAWGSFPITLFLLLTFVGGCTGSASGAIKIFRWEILVMALRTNLWRLIYRHGIRILNYNHRPVREEVIASVLLFMMVYLVGVAGSAALISLAGVDMVTAVTGAATAFGNVGPGLGEVIGPRGNFSTLPGFAKWVLALDMLLGRLEMFTVLVLFTRSFWRG